MAMAEDGESAADIELVARYVKGDIRALERLVERHGRALYGFIGKWTACAATADDVFQETWTKAIRVLDRYRDGNFGAWLVRIARNVIIDESRKRQFQSLPEDGDGAFEPLEASAPAASGMDRMDAQALGEAIWAAVNELPEEQREVFTLRMKAELSFKDIALIQGVSINTALGRMHYAVRRLRQRLAAERRQWRRDGEEE